MKASIRINWHPASISININQHQSASISTNQNQMSRPFGSFGRGLEGWQEEWDQGDKPKHVILPNFNKSRQYWSFEKVRERKSTLLQPESISTNQHKPTSIIINQHQSASASTSINWHQSGSIKNN